jgi:hypothetical protein
MKVGLVFPPMNNFKGLTEAVWTAKSKHDLQVYVQPQWYAQVALAKAWNDGIREAFADHCDYVVVCNDDILFSPDTIDAMVEQYELLHESDKVVMVTPNNIRLQLANPYDIREYVRPSDPFTYSEHPNFSCFLVAPDFFELCGTFDENFWPAWYEDNDMHRRIELLGYKAIMTTAAPQVHYGGISTGMIVNNPGSGQSQQYYISKWGGLPNSHPVSDDLKEKWTVPYGDVTLSPREWIAR